ncbi:MAG: hypothetical protein U0795_01365 [Pirellulales bacterium]
MVTDIGILIILPGITTGRLAEWRRRHRQTFSQLHLIDLLTLISTIGVLLAIFRAPS